MIQDYAYRVTVTNNGGVEIRFGDHTLMFPPYGSYGDKEGHFYIYRDGEQVGEANVSTGESNYFYREASIKPPPKTAGDDEKSNVIITSNPITIDTNYNNKVTMFDKEDWMNQPPCNEGFPGCKYDHPVYQDQLLEPGEVK